MKAFRSLFFLALLLMTACAQPNYDDPTRDPAAQEQGTCDLQFVQSQVCIDLIWEKKPTETEAGSFVLEFYAPGDRSQFVDLPHTLEVVLWMPSMGHGSTPVTIDKLAVGQYRVSKVFFIMHGDWEIQLKLKSGNNVLEQANYPVRF